MLEVLFIGLSLGSILLLVALGLAITFGLMVIMLLLLPEADGRSLAPLETAAARDRSLSHTYSRN